MAKNDVVQKTVNGNGAGAEDIVRSALEHKELFVPAAVGLAGALAAVKGPSLVRGLSSAVEGKVQSTAQGAGSKAAEGAQASIGDKLAGGGLGAKAVGKLTGLSSGSKDGGGGSGGKKTRRLPIQRWTDVAVPVDQAYQAWTEFDKYPKFMHRVLSVKVKGKNKDQVAWEEKIWFSKRQWEGRITEQRENNRIVWKTTSGMSHKGIVSFHKIDDELTRVMVEMEFEPNGIIEKMASGLRFVKRAVQSDLARFKAYVELKDAKGIEYRSADQDQDEEKGDGEDQEQDEEEGREARQSSGQARRRSSGSSGTRSDGRKRTSAKGRSARQTRSSSGSRSSSRSRNN
jgi:uncharacterized membrane protein